MICVYRASAYHRYRDREHATILVNGLLKGIEKSRVEAFFADVSPPDTSFTDVAQCGRIRETNILPGDEHAFDAALVEFFLADAVPDALKRDRKKLDANQVSVSMLWRSTLYVTNFPRDMDDAAMRALLTPVSLQPQRQCLSVEYGNVLQTRWPSRKYADARRFCYITMESPVSVLSPHTSSANIQRLLRKTL